MEFVSDIDKKIHDTKLSLATLEFQKEQEVQAILKEEFHKRGFKAGIKIKPLGFSNDDVILRHTSVLFNSTGDMCLDSHIIYNRTYKTWAEIIIPDGIVIGSYSVSVNDGNAYINGKYYTLSELTTISQLMTTHNDQIKFLMCGCKGEIKVGVEIVNSIINLIKSTT